jgi:hypothetical protein
MTKTFKITMAVLLGSGLLYADTDQYKLYGVESGRIEYTISGNGDMMGIKSRVSGKKKLLFKEYGAKSMTEKEQTQETVMGGKSTVEKTHELTYLDGVMLYNADLKKKRIVRMQNPAIAMMGALGGGKSPMEMGETMLKKMGGKKVGTDKVLGYTCDVWEAMGTRQCIYKGIPLKVVSDVMGIKNTEIATKAVFGTALPDEDFKLPDFPVYDMYGKKLDKSNLAKIDQKEKKEAEQSAEALATAIGAMAAAAESAGIKPGERPSKAQEKDMERAMMAALLPKMKQKILGEEKLLRDARECFSQADTLKEAKICSSKMDDEEEEESDGLNVWNDKTKKETLGLIDRSLSGMECVKKAETMDQMQGCMK